MQISKRIYMYIHIVSYYTHTLKTACVPVRGVWRDYTHNKLTSTTDDFVAFCFCGGHKKRILVSTSLIKDHCIKTRGYIL